MLILITLVMFGAAVILILFNTKQNIVFFYTPTELLDKNVTIKNKIRIGGYVKNKSFKVKSLNYYEFKITDNTNELLVIRGDSGTILTSSDGISWTSRESGSSNKLKGISYGNDLFVMGSTFSCSAPSSAEATEVTRPFSATEA